MYFRTPSSIFGGWSFGIGENRLWEKRYNTPTVILKIYQKTFIMPKESGKINLRPCNTMVWSLTKESRSNGNRTPGLRKPREGYWSWTIWWTKVGTINHADVFDSRSVPQGKYAKTLSRNGHWFCCVKCFPPIGATLWKCIIRPPPNRSGIWWSIYILRWTIRIVYLGIC